MVMITRDPSHDQIRHLKREENNLLAICWNRALEEGGGPWILYGFYLNLIKIQYSRFNLSSKGIQCWCTIGSTHIDFNPIKGDVYHERWKGGRR